MTKFEEFIKILNDGISEFLVIKANPNALPPQLPYATIMALPAIADKNKYYFRSKEQTPSGGIINETVKRRYEAVYQLDLYSKDRQQANEYSRLLFEYVDTILRIPLNIAGYGVLSQRDTSIQDRTYLEHDSNLYRFGFDVTIDYIEEVTRRFEDVDNIEIKDEVNGDTITIVNPNS